MSESKSKAEGWFVDRCIQTVALPPIHIGKNILEAVVPLGPATNLEAFYLLGDFGVRVAGVEKTITPPVRKLAFGDCVPQGLPFYTGNITYQIPFCLEKGGKAVVRTPYYRGALVQAAVDGKVIGTAFMAPYEIELPALTPGNHSLSITLIGTRYNCFGPLHHLDSIPFVQGPGAWRSEEDLWQYEYKFRPMGIMRSPELYHSTGK